MAINNNKEINDVLKKYAFTSKQKREFIKIINPIYKHEEFQRRMSSEFFHHGDITLGVHIIEDAAVTYLKSFNYLKRRCNSSFDLETAVIIAMLHDLYTVPWQNNDVKTYKFFNKHGFRHPIEAVINAVNWYPFLFENRDRAEKIIDGIVHHMFPFPVVVFNNSDSNILELQNFKLLDTFPEYIKAILVKTTNRKKILRVSICRSIYKEGRMMGKADRFVSFRQIRNLSNAMALLTGKNKRL